jgi:hypothetical protein
MMRTPFPQKPETPNQSLQPTAGRADAFLYFMKARLLKSTLAPASGS